MSLTIEQVATRLTGLGGSDAAAACGVSRWRTPMDVYLEKRGESPAFEGNTATDWGERLEPAIRQKYADETGRVVRRPDETLRHPTHSFMLCHPDGVTEDGRLFEAKNTRFGDGWGEPGTDEIPVEYLMQVQHNMAVMGLEVADVAVLISGCDWRLYEVKASAEIAASLVAIEGGLWDRIQRGYPPLPETTNDLVRLYGSESREEVAVADELVETWIEELRTLRRENSEHEEKADALEFKVKAHMKDAARLVTLEGETLATFRSHARKDGRIIRPFKVSEGGK